MMMFVMMMVVYLGFPFLTLSPGLDDNDMDVSDDDGNFGCFTFQHFKDHNLMMTVIC